MECKIHRCDICYHESDKDNPVIGRLSFPDVKGGPEPEHHSIFMIITGGHRRRETRLDLCRECLGPLLMIMEVTRQRNAAAQVSVDQKPAEVVSSVELELTRMLDDANKDVDEGEENDDE